LQGLDALLFFAKNNNNDVNKCYIIKARGVIKSISPGKFKKEYGIETKLQSSIKKTPGENI